MRQVATAVVLCLACNVTLAAIVLDGRIVAVLDGDTLTLLDKTKTEHRIRLAQIDAPEIGHGKNKPGQPFGQRAKQTLSDLAYGRDVRADCAKPDRYGRKVCTIWVGNRDINLELVRRGMAWVYRKYASDPAYYRAEDDAKRTERGLWSDPAAVPPWEWRHR